MSRSSASHAVRSEKIEFEGGHGALLAGRFDRPTGPMRGCALFAHCFTCSKDVQAAARISRALAGRGIGVLRFDFTGLGGSGGDFSSTNFSSNVDDLVRAAEHLGQLHQAPALLIGHSLGGAAVLAAARQVPQARAVATIGAPCDPEHVTHLFADARPEIEAAGEAEVTLAGRRFRIRRQLLDDLREQQLGQHIAELRRPLLLFHAPGDQVVGVDNARRIYELARHPKSFMSLDGADHLLTRAADAEHVAEVLGAWSTRYLEPAEHPHDLPLASAQGTVMVDETGHGALETSIRTSRHWLIGDEPADLGGTDRGPTPYEYLLAALGSCTAMTLRLYARHKQLSLKHVSVTLSHRKVHAKDCADCESQQRKIDELERVIHLEGELTEQQRQRLLEIADKCPVHRTLEGEVKVRSRLEP